MTHNQIRTLALYALFLGITIFMGLTSWGLIRVGVINVTLFHIPTVLAAILLGMKGGLMVGALFAIFSTLSAFGEPSLLVANLMAVNPFFVIIMSLVPRLLLPVTTNLVYQYGIRKESKFAVGGAAILGSLTNTIFYLGLMLLFYILSGLDSTAVAAMIGTIGVLAGPAEALAAMLIAIPVVAAVKKTEKSQDKRG